MCGAVRDNDIGSAPEDQGRLFEAFNSTEAAKAMSVRGTGLGLAIAKGIVGGYGGRL